MMQMLAPYARLNSKEILAVRSGMMGGWSSPFGFNSMNNMMNFGYGFGVFSLFLMLLWWLLIISAIVALVKWLVNQFRGDSARLTTGGTTGKSAIEILMERYAKGEIDRKEFEEKKKDLS